jgi:hypothetical protein
MLIAATLVLAQKRKSKSSSMAPPLPDMVNFLARSSKGAVSDENRPILKALALGQFKVTVESNPLVADRNPRAQGGGRTETKAKNKKQNQPMHG